MLFLHLKPGSHWRIVAYEDRGMHSVDEPHIPLVVVQDESDGTSDAKRETSRAGDFGLGGIATAHRTTQLTGQADIAASKNRLTISGSAPYSAVA